MKQVQRTIVQDGTAYTFSEGSVKGGLRGEKSEMCDVCMTSQRSSRIRHFRGKAYGVDCGCATDIAQLRDRRK